MTRQEVIFEQRLRLALTIVYFCLATANIILKLKERKNRRKHHWQKKKQTPWYNPVMGKWAVPKQRQAKKEQKNRYYKE